MFVPEEEKPTKAMMIRRSVPVWHGLPSVGEAMLRRPQANVRLGLGDWHCLAATTIRAARGKSVPVPYRARRPIWLSISGSGPIPS